MEVQLPAWVDGRYVDLIDVLRMAGPNPWTWRLEEFEGISQPESAIKAGEVGDRVRREGPLTFSWPELVTFAEGLHQTIWCRLVAVDPVMSEPVMIIDCFDSSTWELYSLGPPGSAEALSRVASSWPAPDGPGRR